MLYSRSFYTLLSCCALESLFSVNLRLLLWRAACLCLARYLCKGQHAEEKLVAGNMQSSHSVSHATPTLKSSCQAGWLAWHSRPSCLYFHIGIASMEGSSPSTPGKAILEPKRHTVCVKPQRRRGLLCAVERGSLPAPARCKHKYLFIPAALSPLLHASLWTKVSLCSLAGCPDFSSHQHNEKISS